MVKQYRYFITIIWPNANIEYRISEPHEYWNLAQSVHLYDCITTDATGLVR